MIVSGVAVNDIGEDGVVGGAGGSLAFLYRAGQMRDLNELVIQPAPHLASALKITDGGVILARTSAGRSVLLVPPAPAGPAGLRFTVTGSTVTMEWDPDRRRDGLHRGSRKRPRPA